MSSPLALLENRASIVEQRLRNLNKEKTELDTSIVNAEAELSALFDAIAKLKE